MFSQAEISAIVGKALKIPQFDSNWLKSYEVERASNQLLGFMGEYYKLHVEFTQKSATEKKSLTCFVKSVPISNKFHRDECERKGFFTKEARIYTDILPKMQKFSSSKLAPECYYTRSDVVVLEDLSQSMRQYGNDSEYPPELHKIVLRNQAQFHAASLAWELSEEINIGEKFKDVLIELQLNMSNEWYEAGCKGIVFLARQHTKFQSPESRKFVKDKLYNILAKAENLTKPSEKWCNVLCHRDSWNRNIFFKYMDDQPVACTFVDFQLTRYSPPAIDVLFFLYVTTTVETRQKVMTECLDYYYQSLMEAFAELNLQEVSIGREEFDADCKRAKLAVLILMGICQPLLKMPEGLANKMRAEDPERFDQYMNSDRSELFEKVIQQDEHYKTSVMLAIEELLDYILERNIEE